MFPALERLHRSHFLLIAILIWTWTGCATLPPEPAPTQEEQAREINELFETPVAYSVRHLTPEEVGRFITLSPEYRQDSAEIQAFYARRDGQYAWFVRDTLSTAAMSFLNLVLVQDSTIGLSTGHDAIHELVTRILDRTDTIPLTDRFIAHVELSLTAQFFLFADREYNGYVQRDLRDLDWFIPRRKKDLQQLVDSLAAGRMDLSPIEPRVPQYRRLKKALSRYYKLTWLDTLAPVDLGDVRKLVPGDHHRAIPGIRIRLHAFGDLDPSAGDTLDVLDSALVAGTLRYQARHGLDVDGVIGKGFIEQINVPIADRVRTILMNMERLRWMPADGAPDRIEVNIPEFRMHVIAGDTTTWSMNVVVGAQATSTVIFSDSLSRIVFSPYWSVPSSIVRNEILPAMRRDPNYLAKKGMEIVGGSSSLPVVRQRPGPSNALGLVKFLFPNSYNIYFHDTPSKGAFARETRAVSHGCIRLSEPKRLAEYLLRGDTTWTPNKIEAAMHKGRETTVVLPKKVPVLIGYFTAWVDEKGALNFRNDVYRHDEQLAEELFGVPIPAMDTSAVASAR
ncbi:MAG: L,D-transpeptidase family protein [Flavobacteriales bacterium]|nr:L,D-transpeptidase family protein [Flavobacteriales bacterium]MCB9168631.1 L,D-transpeptidase family protein [Flavobacteriales bacterium]